MLLDNGVITHRIPRSTFVRANKEEATILLFIPLSITKDDHYVHAFVKALFTISLFVLLLST